MPNYDGQDRYVFNGSDELVPALEQRGNSWDPIVESRGDYWVYYFRSKIERSHTQFEQWVHKENRRMHWLTRGRDDTVSVYGQRSDNHGRIADPDDPSRTYLWLIEAQYDQQGNAILYEYLPENMQGVDMRSSFEHDRTPHATHLAQRYLKRIRYGNTQPLRADTPMPDDNEWSFEVVLDYGDHGDERFPTATPSQPWTARVDAYSIYRPGFEIRTYRLCRQVLMFHRFQEHGLNPALVGVTSFEYHEASAGSTLQAIRYTGYRRDEALGTLSYRELPPLRFQYTSPNVGQSFNPIPEETRENLPRGLGGLGYRWIDLYGEGLPGILTETSQAWYYKPNHGEGVFGAQAAVIEKPSMLPGTYMLSDFDQDGNSNLVILQGRQAGYYEFDRDNDGWKNYQPFEAAPQIDLMGAKVQWLDLNGDGQADILISEQDRYVWYPSKGKEGFGDPIELSKIPRSGQPLQLNENPNLDFFFADINGDGLLDLVKVKNGRVEYWPQIGNGRFGDGILMEDAPILDFESEFDASRLRFADLDGSGTADLLYIGRGEVRYWINASGNRYVEGGRLTGLPYLDNLASVQVLDFLGDGTPCLVWSSSLNGSSNAPVQYLQLTNGIKPRLLLSIDNSMGQETRLTYSLSSRHYLRDRRAGREWLSKLPSHTIVVDRKEIVDLIGNASFVSRYEYHDGYFDSEERIFRGFGQVDQYDSEVFRNQETAPEHYTAPTCTRTWFHNGAFGWDIRRFAQYYQGDARQGLLPRDHIDNLVQLGAGEFENGIRTLAGMVIRQEIFATDNTGQRAEHPYQVTQNAYRLRRLQPSNDDDDACFMAYQSEQLAYNYEQQPADPRISHQFTLDVDNYGNVSETCAIAYPRRSNILTALPAQRQIHITASRQSYLNIDQSDRRELGIPIESKTFEIGHLQPAEDTLFQFDFLKNVLRPALSSSLSFHDTFSATASRTQARLIGWNQNYYWNDDRSAVLPLRQVGQRTLLHHTEATCFTDELIAETLGDRISPDMLETDGHYYFREGYWWQRSPVTHYLLAEHFNLLARIEHLNGGSIAYTYDAPYYLTLIQTQDALVNRTRAEIDYHVIAPRRITDINDNIAEVLYDPLGMVVVSTERGSILGSGGTAERYGNDLLADYTLQADATFDSVLAQPERYLQTASQFFYYELTSDTPSRSIVLTREDWVYDGQGNRASSSRIQMNVSYADGFGRSLQTKQKVEGGPAIHRDASGRVILTASGTPEEESIIDRWLVSGHVVFNNKQQPVRQYEPFYSSSVAFESDAELQHFGVSALSRYDPAGRLIQTDLPNGTLTRAEFTPWEIRQYDPNDTVQEASSSYRVVRELLLDTDPEKQALRKAQVHADTPTITQLDSLGREIVHIQTSHEGANRTTQSHFDIQGNVTSVIDARGLTAFTYRYDMLGRGLYQHSMDAGEAWSFPDALDQPIHQWNGRGIHRQTRFDLLGRPTQILIEDAAGPRMAERMRYGEDPSVTEAALKNARGQLVHHHDQAGIQTVHQYAPNGTPLRSERHLLEDYTSEPDWTLPDTVNLDPSLRFETRSVLDALGRVKRQHLPDGTTRWMDYLQSGGLAQIRVSTADGGLNAFPFLKESEFNARGQRIRTVMGNETEIEVAYKYDPVTFRMNQLTSRQISGNRARLYQDISYTYDPAGNIVHHVDRAQQPVGASPQLIVGLNVSSHCDFTYDAFYQLTEATGRVHEALMAHDYRPGLPEPALKHTQHLTLNNGAVVGRYTHSYSYDLAGNIQRIRHQAPNHSWTRTMWISASSNRSLPATDHNDLPITNPESRFDASGNCIDMPHLRAVDWNDRGNISHVVIVDRTSEGQPSDREYYVYGSDGMRLRKVHEQLVGSGQLRITEKIYLNGGEIKRIRHNGELILERTTSHISDRVSRIAVLHQWSQDQFGNETNDISQKKIHYQLSNHLGSSSLEIGEAGNVISYEEYFPFGGSAFVAGDNRREISLKDYRYSGKERDDATGFYYYGHRYYVPWTGRWLSPDPIGPEDSMNLYQFVQNNPINLIDPNGLQSFMWRELRYPSDLNEDTPENRAAVSSHLRIHQGFVVEDLRFNPNAERPILNEAGEQIGVQRGRWEFAGYYIDTGGFLSGSNGLGGTAPPQINEVGVGAIPFGNLDISSVGEPDLTLPSREEEREGRGISGRGEPESEDGNHDTEGQVETNGDDQGSIDGSGGSGGEGTGQGRRGFGGGGGGSSTELGTGGIGSGSGAGRRGVQQGQRLVESSVRRGRGSEGRMHDSREHAHDTSHSLISHGGGSSTDQSGISRDTERGQVPPEGISPSVNTDHHGAVDGTSATGAPTGINDSSGNGGLSVGDNTTGSRFGSQSGGIDGSLISGGEGGTEAPDLGDDIVNAIAIANGDVFGYDPNNPHARESGIPSGELGLIDFGDSNKALYLVQQVASVFGGALLSRFFSKLKTFIRNQRFLRQVMRKYNDILSEVPEILGNLEIWRKSQRIGDEYVVHIVNIRDATTSGIGTIAPKIQNARDIRRLISKFEEEARAAGASSIRVYGHLVEHPRFADPSLAERLGFGGLVEIATNPKTVVTTGTRLLH